MLDGFIHSSIVCITYLDGAVVDEKTVQLLEGLASAIRVTEGNVRDAAADGVGSVGDFYPLDGSN